MIITKELINLYLGRDYNLEEVIIHFKNDESTIFEWNITDKPQPTIEELEELQSQVEQQEQNAKEITKRQLNFWIYLKKGIKEDDIYTAINSIEDEKTRYLAEQSYKGTNTFVYGNPFVSVIGIALGLTEQDLIQCFDEARLM